MRNTQCLQDHQSSYIKKYEKLYHQQLLKTQMQKNNIKYYPSSKQNFTITTYTQGNQKETVLFIYLIHQYTGEAFVIQIKEPISFTTENGSLYSFSPLDLLKIIDRNYEQGLHVLENAEVILQFSFAQCPVKLNFPKISHVQDIGTAIRFKIQNQNFTSKLEEMEKTLTKRQQKIQHRIFNMEQRFEQMSKIIQQRQKQPTNQEQLSRPRLESPSKSKESNGLDCQTQKLVKKLNLESIQNQTQFNIFREEVMKCTQSNYEKIINEVNLRNTQAENQLKLTLKRLEDQLETYKINQSKKFNVVIEAEFQKLQKFKANINEQFAMEKLEVNKMLTERAAEIQKEIMRKLIKNQQKMRIERNSISSPLDTVLIDQSSILKNGEQISRLENEIQNNMNQLFTNISEKYPPKVVQREHSITIKKNQNVPKTSFNCFLSKLILQKDTILQLMIRTKSQSFVLGICTQLSTKNQWIFQDSQSIFRTWLGSQFILGEEEGQDEVQSQPQVKEMKMIVNLKNWTIAWIVQNLEYKHKIPEALRNYELHPAILIQDEQVELFQMQ